MENSINNLKRQLEVSEKKRVRLQRLLMCESNEDENLGLWTMLDLMTLLLIFFIMLYSKQTIQQNNIDIPVVQTENQVIATKTFPLENKILTAISEAMSFEKNTTDLPLSEMKKEILNVLKDNDDSDYFVEWNQQRLVIVLGESICFQSGQADLLYDIKYSLKKLARIIGGKKGYKVAVSGHTDDTPIYTDKFPSNWELSVARAVNTAKILIKNGVDPSSMSIEGYAQYQPMLPNDTKENRKGNRRVEISLIRDNS